MVRKVKGHLSAKVTGSQAVSGLLDHCLVRSLKAIGGLRSQGYLFAGLCLLSACLILCLLVGRKIDCHHEDSLLGTRIDQKRSHV